MKISKNNKNKLNSKNLLKVPKSCRAVDIHRVQTRNSTTSIASKKFFESLPFRKPYINTLNDKQRQSLERFEANLYRRIGLDNFKKKPKKSAAYIKEIVNPLSLRPTSNSAKLLEKNPSIHTLNSQKMPETVKIEENKTESDKNLKLLFYVDNNNEKSNGCCSICYRNRKKLRIVSLFTTGVLLFIVIIVLMILKIKKII